MTYSVHTCTCTVCMGRVRAWEVGLLQIFYKDIARLDAHCTHRTSMFLKIYMYNIMYNNATTSDLHDGGTGSSPH